MVNGVYAFHRDVPLRLVGYNKYPAAPTWHIAVETIDYLRSQLIMRGLDPRLAETRITLIKAHVMEIDVLRFEMSVIV